MLSYIEARNLIISSLNTLEAINLPISESLHHTLAEPVIAPFEMPLFDNSAVDGYGVLVNDLINADLNNPIELKLIGSLEAGTKNFDAQPQIKLGECVKILTGAPVPPGVEAVIMKEYSAFEKRTDIGLFFKSVSKGENIRKRGEELKKGDRVIPANSRINAPVVGVLASLGYANFKVIKQPRIAILTTGDELIEPGQNLARNQIFNSNSYAIEAACKSLGLSQIIKLHCNDTREDTIEKMTQAIEFADVIICTGGVSVGDRDLVKPVLEEDFKVETILWRIAIKPGKPVFFARKNEKYFFGLPGNPVSALVTFHLFVKPALMKLQGIAPCDPAQNRAILNKKIKKRAGRMEFVRGIQKRTKDDNLMVEPTRGQESHMLSGLAAADCLIHFDLEDEILDENTQVEIQKLDWQNY
ncbi:MAG: molybdopterin molybdotransferase MoeA [Candidatus Melainabacteria bacterium]|nr:molybdopterin molybdotransferase MoeA [Candidatus Melainabacteria bacterium]